MSTSHGTRMYAPRVRTHITQAPTAVVLRRPSPVQVVAVIKVRKLEGAGDAVEATGALLEQLCAHLHERRLACASGVQRLHGCS